MNQFNIIGNLTADPQRAATQSGKDVTSFTVAVTDRFNKEHTDFIRVSAWNRLADITAKYLKRGSKVYVSGRVTARAYTTKQGEARASLQMTAEDVEFLSKAERGDADDAEFVGTLQTAGIPVEIGESLPF